MPGLAAPSPPPITSPPTSGVMDSNTTGQAWCRVRGELRDVRAEVQNLHVSLRDIKVQCELIDPHVRQQAVRAALAQAALVFDTNRRQVDQRLADVRSLLLAHPAIHDAIGDVVTQVENAWERMAMAWPESRLSAEEVLSRYARLEENMSAIVSHCGLLTIPTRVNEHLRGLRVGQPLDFRKAFQDELPSEDDLRKLLEVLAAHPNDIEGVIDVEAGRIFRAHPDDWRRFLSYAYVVLTIILGVGVMYGLSEADDLTGGSNISFREWLSGYAAVLLGSLVHVLIDALKQSRKKTDAAFRAVDDWLLWVHIRETSIIMSIVAVWVSVIGIGLTQRNVDLAAAFFVGYSIDSFLDLFLERFDKHATIKTKVLKERLGA